MFDRRKTIALRWRRNGEVTEWNPVFAHATLDIGVGVKLRWFCQAGKRAGWKIWWVFRVRGFYDLEDLSNNGGIGSVK